MNTVRILFATIFQNSGDATRALEIAKALRDDLRSDYRAEIIFLTRGSRFDRVAETEGFTLYRAQPQLGGVQYLDDFRTRFGELIGDEALAAEILRGEIAAYRALRPDLLIYGFWPVGSIARRMAIPDTPAIAFLPLPLTEDFLRTIHRFPNEMALSRLPEGVQRLLLGVVPRAVKERIPALRHSCIRRAAEQLGWRGEPLVNVFRMLRSDCYLVNDFPAFYPTGTFDRRVVFTGPLFPQPDTAEITDPRILEVLAPDNPRPKIFCSLGSSGSKRALLDAIRMFSGPGASWSGVVLCPPAICPLDEARAELHNPHVVLTDAFVPAARINARVDAVVCHGGQGTLQTALLSGTPLVGVPAQPEQQMNLQHLEAFGAAIAIAPRNWRAPAIARAVSRILADGRYRTQAQLLRRQASELHPRERIVAEVRKFLP